MDNITHSLVGLAVAKAGLEKLSPTATLASIVAANAPDADIIYLLAGDRWSFLAHHRGLSHSIIGTFTLALLIPLIFYSIDILIASATNRERVVSFKGLLITCLAVAPTHPLLDWTNNYGVRLLLPWSSRWFYGDLVFIVDPFMWLVIGGAAFLASSPSRKQLILWLGLAAVLTLIVFFGASERLGEPHLFWFRILWIGGLGCATVLFRLERLVRWKRTIALAGLTIVVLYWGGLFSLHAHALSKSRNEAAAIASSRGENVLEIAAMPTLANPFEWRTVFTTESSIYRFDLLLSSSRLRSEPVRFERLNAVNAWLKEAQSDRRARIFLGFARFPVARVVDPSCMEQTLVQFADLRYTEPGTQRGTFALEVPVECATQTAETQTNER